MVKSWKDGTIYTHGERTEPVRFRHHWDDNQVEIITTTNPQFPTKGNSRTITLSREEFERMMELGAVVLEDMDKE